MKKVMFIALIVVLLMAVALPVLAGGPKTEICHTTDAFDIPQNEWTQVVGHRITVADKALPAHMAHGDFIYTPENDIDYGPVIYGLTWRQIAENNGLNLAGVNCSGFVLDF